MMNLFNMLNETASKKTNTKSTFGDLVDKNTYQFEITKATAKATRTGHPMLELETKTISGDTGIGTKIKTWYVLNTNDDGTLEEGKEFQSSVLMQLIGAINITAADILADNYQDFLAEIAERINEAPAKTFMAEVEAKPDFESANGRVYKQWGIKPFSVMPINEINTATPVTTTTAEAIKQEFDFNA